MTSLKMGVGRWLSWKVFQKKGHLKLFLKGYAHLYREENSLNPSAFQLQQYGYQFSLPNRGVSYSWSGESRSCTLSYTYKRACHSAGQGIEPTYT